MLWLFTPPCVPPVLFYGKTGAETQGGDQARLSLTNWDNKAASFTVLPLLRKTCVVASVTPAHSGNPVEACIIYARL